MLPLLWDLPTIGPGQHPAPGPLDIHLWHQDYRASVRPERISALLALLSPAERARFARLRDQRRGEQFVLGRALCRQVLSRYAPASPEDWLFALGSRGKPFLVAPELTSPLWFNLSHADGVSVCAVTGAGPEIGIDIEQISPGGESHEIAEQFFPEVEVNALRLLSAAERDEKFVRIWALKESFVKARETSLADGISGTAFDLARLDNIGVTFGAPIHESAQEWKFQLFRLDLGRIVAVAVRARTAGPLSLRLGTGLEL